MALATTYGDGSELNREDLRDMITLVTPEMFPLQSMVRKGPAAKAMYTEWGMDDLDPVDFTAVEEGADVTEHSNPAEHRVRVGNYQQKTRKSWQVSKEQMLTATAGVPSEVARARSHKIREHKQAIESLFCSDQEMSSTNPTKSRGLGKWIQSEAQETNPVPEQYRTPANSINNTATASFSDDDLNGVIQSVYEQTGSPSGSFTLIAGPNLRAAVSDLQRVSGSNFQTYNVNQDATSHRIDLRVDEYHSNFGTVFVMPSLFLGKEASGNGALTDAQSARGFLLDTSAVEILELSALAGFTQEDDGAGPRGYTEYIATLCVKSPLKIGKFNATS